MLTDYIEMRTANVYGIYGHLGGGKSLTAVEIMLHFLKLGHTVVSNIQLFHHPNPDHFKFVEDFSTVDWWKLPCGAPRGSSDPYRVAIVIDECAEFFDQYSGASYQVKQFLSWLRHSSKRGQFVFAIVQKPEFIAKPLRLLINRWIMCDDMEQFRLPFLRLKLPFLAQYVRRLMFDRYGNLISRGTNFADKALIGYYYNTAQSIALQGRENDYHQQTHQRPQPYGRLFLLLSIIYTLYLIIYS